MKTKLDEFRNFPPPVPYKWVCSTTPLKWGFSTEKIQDDWDEATPHQIRGLVWREIGCGGDMLCKTPLLKFRITVRPKKLAMLSVGFDGSSLQEICSHVDIKEGEISELKFFAELFLFQKQKELNEYLKF